MKAHILPLTIVVSALSALAQAPGETTYGKYELNLFGGGSFFKRQQPRPYFDLNNGGTVGFRITQNYWKYVGIEEAVGVHGVNNLTVAQPNTFNDISFGARQRYFTINPVLHFTPRESRFRPFVTAGPGFAWTVPTDRARTAAQAPNGGGIGAATNLETAFGPLFNYGGGLKWKLAERVGIRVDARHFVTRGTTLGIPRTPAPLATAITMPSERQALQSGQLTAGLTFYMGKLAEAPIGDFRAGAIEASAQAICPGESVTFRVPVTNTMNGMQSKFKWTINGKDGGSTTDSLTMRAPDQAGTANVRVVVDADASQVKEKNILRFLKKNPIAASARDASVRVKEYKAPGVRASAESANVPVNGSTTLTATPSLSECSGDATYTWTLDGGGSLSGTGASRTFSASNMGLACGTTRTVTAKVSIRDSKGATGEASVPVTVTAAACPPPPPPPPALRATQYDDILFAAPGNSRVNNCGKRTLDRAYEQVVASGDYDILLVGHIDEAEKKIRRRKNQKAIDRERVENAAAYLISGDQPCKRLDRSRVKIAVAGDSQTSPLRTTLCEDSVRERSGSKVRTRDDRARFRRVEVWIVPRDGKGPMPTGIPATEQAPEAKACPK